MIHGSLSGYDLPLVGWVCIPARHVNTAPDTRTDGDDTEPDPPATCALSTCGSKSFERIPLTPPRRAT